MINSSTPIYDKMLYSATVQHRSMRVIPLDFYAGDPYPRITVDNHLVEVEPFYFNKLDNTFYDQDGYSVSNIHEYVRPGDVDIFLYKQETMLIYNDDYDVVYGLIW